ncbi:glycosyltransferase family 2 protein [Roseateles sp.]|uniref:glycosyltransferase family 2 protein n=1 Tax=Roseateles sp. TaxID=1971397 RepID=UPI002E0877E4|nr:glycosyltransferase family 2 protein [Roseateles sp.]
MRNSLVEAPTTFGRNSGTHDLTVCVIGRNEAGNLPACAASLAQLRTAGLDVETIFVDSASTDASVEIASRHFNIVLELEGGANLNAGAARAVGTTASQARWILYLDGDMVLREEFVPELLKLIHSFRGPEGLAGYTRNIYPDGSSDLMALVGNLPGQPCRAFGGAVALRRDLVMEVGNWASNLYSNEEAELYSRLLQRSVKVIWTDTLMVDHLTPRYSPSHRLRGSLLPWGSHLGKKFYGAGQATRRAWRHGNLTSFVRLKPLQYLMTTAIVLSVLSLPVLPWLALWLPIGAFVWIAALRGPKFAVNCICWTSQTLFGLSKLDPNYRPSIVRTRRKDQDLGASSS